MKSFGILHFAGRVSAFVIAASSISILRVTCRFNTISSLLPATSLKYRETKRFAFAGPPR